MAKIDNNKLMRFFIIAGRDLLREGYTEIFLSEYFMKY